MKQEDDEIPTEEIEDPQTEIEQLSDHLREYVGIRRELFELKLWDKLFNASAVAIAWSVIIFLGAISFFLLSAGLAWWIGMSIGKVYLGFIIVAGALGMIAMLVYVGRDRFLQKPLADRFIEHLINEEEEEDDEIAGEENNEQRAA